LINFSLSFGTQVNWLILITPAQVRDEIERLNPLFPIQSGNVLSLGRYTKSLLSTYSQLAEVVCVTNNYLISESIILKMKNELNFFELVV
jgi:hypothetical protein